MRRTLAQVDSGGAVRPGRALVLIAVVALWLAAAPAIALADPVEDLPALGLVERSELTTGVKLLLFFTGLALLPALVISVTSFTRIAVVLAFLRQAMGVQQIPPGPVLIAIALMLTLFVMSPVIGEINRQAISPLVDGQISEQEALSRGLEPLRRFMLGEAREKDVALFIQLAHRERPASPDDIPMHVLMPSFLISELRTAFEIGFMLYLPFLVIDMVIASVLMSMGMMMLPPVIVSLPFKILLFVLVDGWNLVAGGLVSGFA